VEFHEILFVISIAIIICSICPAIILIIMLKDRKQNKKCNTRVKYLEGSISKKDYDNYITCKGDYYLFSSRYPDEYLMFLDDLDQSIYEIVNIQIDSSICERYLVTYIKKIK